MIVKLCWKDYTFRWKSTRKINKTKYLEECSPITAGMTIIRWFKIGFSNCWAITFKISVFFRISCMNKIWPKIRRYSFGIFEHNKLECKPWPTHPTPLFQMKNPAITSQNAGAPVQPEKIDSIENEDGITIGDTYLVRRADSSVCQAQVIQARMSEFGYYEYYVHYVGLNRRLDQWVQRSQLLSSPSPESLESPQTIRVSTDGPSLDQLTDDSSDRKITRNQKRRHDEINHVQKTYAEMDPTTGKNWIFNVKFLPDQSDPPLSTTKMFGDYLQLHWRKNTKLLLKWSTSTPSELATLKLKHGISHRIPKSMAKWRHCICANIVWNTWNWRNRSEAIR